MKMLSCVKSQAVFPGKSWWMLTVVYGTRQQLAAMDQITYMVTRLDMENTDLRKMRKNVIYDVMPFR